MIALSHVSNFPLGSHVAWDKRLFAVFHAAVEEYAGPYADFPLYSVQTHNWTLRDAGYTLHSRNASVPQQHPTTLYMQYPRALLVGILLLNDDVAGGEWWFPGITSVSPACGTLLLFPNLFTHPWGVREIRLGTLYYISTLFSLS